MKYQEGLKETKDFLKTTPEPQMRELCNKAGLQPTPKPAYLTCSPYQAQMFPFGNYGCGSCGY